MNEKKEMIRNEEDNDGLIRVEEREKEREGKYRERRTLRKDERRPLVFTKIHDYVFAVVSAGV